MQTIHLYKDAAYKHMDGNVFKNVTKFNSFRKGTANIKKNKIFNYLTILCNCEWNRLFSLFHLLSRGGKKSKFFFLQSHCKPHTFWCPFGSA